MTVKLSVRSPNCLSDLVLDAMLAEDAEIPAHDAARAHIETCTACRERLRARRAERDAFAAEPLPALIRGAEVLRSAPRDTPVAAPLARVAPKRSRRALYLASSGLALAAALLLFLRARPADDSDARATRLKGGSHIGFYVKRGDVVTLGEPGARVRPGDALRFSYTTDEAHLFLAVLSLDGAKHASAYFPDGPSAAHVDAASARALDASTVLDATLGDETIYGVFCGTPFTTEPLRASLEARGRLVASEGCVVDAVAIHKEAPTSP